MYADGGAGKLHKNSESVRVMWFFKEIRVITKSLLCNDHFKLVDKTYIYRLNKLPKITQFRSSLWFIL